MKDSIILVEGADCTGKSTLIQKMIEKVQKDKNSLYYVHNGLYPNSKEAFDAYDDQIQISNRLIRIKPLNSKYVICIFDRGAISEFIYGKIIRRYDCFIDLTLYLNLVASNQEFKLILCMPPIEFCIENWQKRLKQEYVQKKDLLIEIYGSMISIAEEYEKMFEGKVIYYDYTRHSTNHIISLAME